MHCRISPLLILKSNFGDPLPPPLPQKAGEREGPKKFQIRKKFLCERKTPGASFEFPDQLVYHRPIVRAGVLKFDPILISLMPKRLNHLLFNKLFFFFFLFIEVNTEQSLLKSYQLQLLVSAIKNCLKMKF